MKNIKTFENFSSLNEGKRRGRKGGSFRDKDLKLWIIFIKPRN